MSVLRALKKKSKVAVAPAIVAIKMKIRVKEKMSGESSSDLRLPLDLLIILDVETLEDALVCQYAVEYENEIKFCKNDDDLATVIEDMEGAKYYKVDDIELDRIQAIIDLLNKAEEDAILSHILDRIVR